MARKHENFNYNGYKYASESYTFFLNGKRLNLDSETRSDLGYMCMCGRIKEAEDQLKRILRKEEKEPLTVGKCICFFKEGSDDFYYTQALRYDPDDRKAALHAYKTWKQYIKDKDCVLESGYELTSGIINPFSDNNKAIKKVIKNKVDLSRKRTIRVIRESILD